MALVEFYKMTEAEIRDSVERHPDRVNEKDTHGHRMLITAIVIGMSPAFISWLVKKKGADVSMGNSYGWSPLHMTASAEVVNTLLKAGASRTCYSNTYQYTPLMNHCSNGRAACVERLLQEPAIIETIDQQGDSGHTAFFRACSAIMGNQSSTLEIPKMLLRAGVDPTIADDKGRTPLEYVRRNQPNNYALIAFLEHASSTYPRIVLLTKARHITAAHRALTRATPSFLQPRMPPLPCVEFATHTHTHTHEEDEEEKTKRMAMLRHVLGSNEDGSPGGMLDELFLELIEFMRPA